MVSRKLLTNLCTDMGKVSHDIQQHPIKISLAMLNWTIISGRLTGELSILVALIIGVAMPCRLTNQLSHTICSWIYYFQIRAWQPLSLEPRPFTV